VNGGAKPALADQNGNVPLEMAQKYGKSDIEEFLKKSSAGSS
jgi:hypothetical protein